jgi:hypothetical protein
MSHLFRSGGTLLLAVWLLSVAAGPSGAQDYRARVQGVVTDASQAVVVGARVILRNENTGVENTRITNETGHYFFDFVEPGTYTVIVEMQGFRRFVSASIPVQVTSPRT